jgi:SAM-dependent methyltransferase
MTADAPTRNPDEWSAGARIYDEVFAPLTRVFADHTLDLLEVTAADRVLDVAAGTGAFALGAAARGAEVLATDFAPDMLAVLDARARALGLATVTTAVMNATALDLADGSFTVAASMFGVVFCPDLETALREIARVAAPEGRIAFSCWDAERADFHSLVVRAITETDPLIAPPPQSPALGSAEGVAEEMDAAGWDDTEVHTFDAVLEIPDPIAYFRALPYWAMPLRPLFEQLDRDRVDAAAETFANLVAEAGPDGNRVAARGHIGIGHVA